MPALLGPGPVFEYEWLTSSRRWQLFAMRSLFATALLIALGISWGSPGSRSASINQAQARLAMKAYNAVVGTQLALVLLAAPAATAGSICIDKARGTMAHVLVTDLSDAEVVLGKLAARLMPVLGLIGCTLPVVSLCILLGGIDPAALAGAYAVTAALAILGCSLALTLSIWARKTHEVLLATYLILIAWLLARPIAGLLSWVPGSLEVREWLRHADPIHLTLDNYGALASAPGVWEIAGFCAGCLLVSAALLTLAVRRLRPVAVREPERPARRGWAKESRARGLAAVWERIAVQLPGPSLEGNPVLWREWHRNRPSPWSRRLWAFFIAASIFFTLVALSNHLSSGRNAWRTSLWINGFQVATGILLLSVGASTSLAEERARGSLDVLMTTPLTTSSIVWGKWLAAFRAVPWIAVLPTLLAASLSWGSGAWLVAPILAALIVSYGAFITSLGLALATWVPRLGRAVAICVAVDVFLTVGTFFLILMIYGPRGEMMLAVSPFGGPAILTADAVGHVPGRRGQWGPGVGVEEVLSDFRWELFAIFAYSAAAGVLLSATLRTFDRCLGRIVVGSLNPAYLRSKPDPKTWNGRDLDVV